MPAMTTRKPRHAESKLHRKLVLFAAALEERLQHFPSCHKYALTQEMRRAFVDVYGLVAEGQKRWHKKTTLSSLDIRHEQMRMLLWLAFELRLFAAVKGRIDGGQAEADRKYLHLSAMWDEIGALIGGWINTEFPPHSAQAAAPAPEAA